LSNAVRIVKRLPDNIKIYSNGEDALEFLTGKEVYAIPPMEVPGSGMKNDNFEAELQFMQETLASTGGLLVYLNLVDWRWYLPTSEFLSLNMPLYIKYQGPDGTIYQVLNEEKSSGSEPWSK